MRRRGVGIRGIATKSAVQAKFKEKGSEIASEQLVQLSNQLQSFKEHLQDFAKKHKNEIRQNSKFRRQFQEMCAAIGVDPLASSKGFWAETLGVGDFYYELAIQVIEVCLATCHHNGGLLSLCELTEKVRKSRGSHQQSVSSEDIRVAIKKVRILGNGFTLLQVGNTEMVQAVPGELSLDHLAAMQAAGDEGHIGKEEMKSCLHWTEERCDRAIEQLLLSGLVWIDQQGTSPQYWFPSLLSDLVHT